VPEERLCERALALRVLERRRGLRRIDGHARALRQHVRAHRPHATAVVTVGDQERLVPAGPRRAQPDEHVDPACGEVFRGVDALVAHHLVGLRVVRRPEHPGLRERLQQAAHLALESRPYRRVVRLEDRPARAALDARHEEQPSPLRREQRTLGARGRAARERTERQRARDRRAQRLQRIDAVRREPLALAVGEDALRPRARPHEQLVVDARVPRRALLVEAGERSCDRAAVRKELRVATQPVEGDDARIAEQRVIGTELEVAQAVERVGAGFPRRGRIDDQDRVVIAAPAIGDDERARAHVAVARERRDAQETHFFGRRQREESAAGLGRADDVVVRERRAVVAVGVRVDVADRVTRARADRTVRADGGRWPAHADHRRLLQHGEDVTRRVRQHRQPPEDLLVLDVLGTSSAHALHDQVEAVGLVGADVVVVDRRPERLSGTRAHGLERQRVGAAGQGEGRGRTAVHHADDDRCAAAVLEVLLDCIRERARLPEAAEDDLELGVAADRHRLVDRAPQRAPDERGDGGRQAQDGAVRARPFRHDHSAECPFPQTRVPCSSRGYVSTGSSGLARLRTPPLARVRSVRRRRAAPPRRGSRALADD